MDPELIPIPQPQTKPTRRFLLPLLLTTVVILAAISSLLAYQNLQLQKQIMFLQNPPISPIPPSPAEALAKEGTANWKTYTTATYNFSFSYPPDSKPPYERNSLPDDTNKYIAIDFDSTCFSIEVMPYTTNNSLENFIRYEYYKFKSDKEWLDYDYPAIYGGRMKFGENEMIDTGSGGVLQVHNYFIKISSSLVLGITVSQSTQNGINAGNPNAKQEIDQILSTFTFTE